MFCKFCAHKKLFVCGLQVVWMTLLCAIWMALSFERFWNHVNAHFIDGQGWVLKIQSRHCCLEGTDVTQLSCVWFSRLKIFLGTERMFCGWLGDCKDTRQSCNAFGDGNGCPDISRPPWECIGKSTHGFWCCSITFSVFLSWMKLISCVELSTSVRIPVSLRFG